MNFETVCWCISGTIGLGLLYAKIIDEYSLSKMSPQQRDRIQRSREAERKKRKEQYAQIEHERWLNGKFGSVRSEMVCSRCHAKGKVRTKKVALLNGIYTQAYCDRCKRGYTFHQL